MSSKTIYESDQVTVWFYPEKKIIHHQMHKYTHDKVFREALTAGAEAMEKFKAQKWLSDDRQNPVLNPEDQKWATDVWQSKIIKAGWKYWAIVQPESQINKMRMEKLANDFTKLGVTVQFFNDPDEAMTWLASQK